MQSKKMKSLSEIVDKMNKAYDGLICQGFSPGVGRRVVPVMAENEVLGWKMQRYENEQWVDLDEMPFTTIEELIAHYKSES
jgi:hypothetical protein